MYVLLALAFVGSMIISSFLADQLERAILYLVIGIAANVFVFRHMFKAANKDTLKAAIFSLCFYFIIDPASLVLMNLAVRWSILSPVHYSEYAAKQWFAGISFSFVAGIVYFLIVSSKTQVSERK